MRRAWFPRFQPARSRGSSRFVATPERAFWHRSGNPRRGGRSGFRSWRDSVRGNRLIQQKPEEPQGVGSLRKFSEIDWLSNEGIGPRREAAEHVLVFSRGGQNDHRKQARAFVR